ncbi:sensor histidine kinase [Paenibacillus tritici]|uniref:histidine kinase n=1 Tax=Paenibacillus tritici TaxID=1873425 RepID=A0ABX2DNY2_9BACL|nr:histidine kinase [Paenibacillus tritici]NQX45571.1 sensor histidine kinase [Paenibacillus tritici]
MFAPWIRRFTGPFRRSIRNRLMLTMIMLAVAPIVAITGLAAENNRRSMEEEVISTTLSNMKWTGIHLGSQFAQLNNLIYTVLISPHLSDYLANAEEPGLSSQFTYQRNIIDTLTNLFYSAGNHVIGVELYLKEYNKLFTVDASSSDIASPPSVPAAYKPLFEQNRDFTITTDAGDTSRFQLIRSINRFENQEKLGGISLQIRWGMLDQTLNLLRRGSDDMVFIAGADGKILYQPSGMTPSAATLSRIAGIGEAQGYFRGEDEYVFYSTIDPVGLKLVTILPTSFINESAMKTMKFGLIIGAISVSVAILLAVLLAWRLATPIVNLARSIQGFGMMKQREQRANIRVDEIGLLEMKLDQMSHRIREHIKNEYMITLEKKSAELKALQAQINPHFLQNTLQMIGSMLFKNSPSESYGVLRSLSDMFRYIIREPDDLAPLRAELKHLSDYMQIQQQRFAARLSYSLEVDEAALSSLIPKLSLQPIVENAFFHGLEPKEGAWELKVQVTCRDGDTVICISDNGIGIEAVRLAELQRSLSREDGAWTSGERIGLGNVAGRIRMHFGSGYGVGVTSRQGQGTAVSLTIPQERKEMGA